VRALAAFASPGSSVIIPAPDHRRAGNGAAIGGVLTHLNGGGRDNVTILPKGVTIEHHAEACETHGGVEMTDRPTDPRQWEHEPFCYLTTTGRVTGTPHEVEIWFALHMEDATQLAMLAGGGMRSDWVKNLAKTPDVTIRIGQLTYPATARIVPPGDPDEAWMRRALVEKYRRPDQPLTDWGRTALPVLFTLHPGAARQTE
jgi:deazaflavin-dependent oxidoreductase (nitroreductase family)